MRILFVTYPEKPVFQYLVTMGWALRTAGHEVRFASQGNFVDVITAAGLTAVPTGSNPQPWRVTHLSAAQRRIERAGLPAPYDAAAAPERATWPYLRDGYADHVVGRYVMESLPMIDELVQFACAWSPDLVIWEPNCMAGPIAAKVSGCAHARLLFGLDIFGATRELFHRLRAQQPPDDQLDALGNWFGKQLAPYGMEPSDDMATGNFTIDQFPASLQLTTGLHQVRTRYVPFGGRAVVPSWLRTPPQRPRIGFTMGFSATEHFDGYPIDVGDALRELAELDVEVVATVATSEQHRLGPLPDTVRVVPSVPLHALASTCTAMVHHAGAATMATVSLSGIPQLAVHHHFDQPEFGRLLEAHGAGLALDSSEATGAAVRDRVSRLLTEPAFRARAADLRAEMQALPSPNEVVDELVDLAEALRPEQP